MKLPSHLSVALLSFALPAMGAALSLETRQCSAQCGDPIANSLELIRSYSSTKTDHFYTTSVLEFLDYESQGLDYAYENVAGRIFFTQQPGTVPFYRLYNSATTDHAYTASLQQVNTYKTVFNPPYADDGIAGYVYVDASCPGTVPFYWAYNAAQADSFYTIFESEYNTATTTGGYTAQGITAYIYPEAFAYISIEGS